MFADFVNEAVYRANVEHVTINLEYAFTGRHGPRSAPAKLARSGPTYPKQLRARQHAFLEAGIEEVHVVPEELVDRLDLACLKLTLKLSPVRLQDLESREGKDLLHKR